MLSWSTGAGLWEAMGDTERGIFERIAKKTNDQLLGVSNSDSKKNSPKFNLLIYHTLTMRLSFISLAIHPKNIAANSFLFYDDCVR